MIMIKGLFVLSNTFKYYDEIINSINKEILKIEQNKEPKVCKICGSIENRFQEHKKPEINVF